MRLTPFADASLPPWTVRQHIPGYISGVETQDTTVASVDELLALPWVKRWDNGRLTRFSVALAHRDSTHAEFWDQYPKTHGRCVHEHHLMAEMKDGSFWVLAYLDALGDWSVLPVWREP